MWVSPLVVGGLCEGIVSVLFGKIAAKRTKNGVGGVSRLRARLGALPQDPESLCKGLTQTFHTSDLIFI